MWSIIFWFFVCFAERYGSIDPWSEMDPAPWVTARLLRWGQAPGRRFLVKVSAAWCLFFWGRNYETIFDDVFVRDDGRTSFGIFQFCCGLMRSCFPTKYPCGLFLHPWLIWDGRDLSGWYKGPLHLWFNHLPLIFWLVVWNHGILWLSIYWECHHPNWRAYFSEGSVNHQPVFVHHWCTRSRSLSLGSLPSSQAWI